MQMAVELKKAEDDKMSLQQALKLEIESRMQLEGTVTILCQFMFVWQFKLTDGSNHTVSSQG